jgi:hypothetical protein
MRVLTLAGLMFLAPLRAGDVDAAKAAIGRLDAKEALAGRLSEIYERQLGADAHKVRADLALDLKADTTTLDLAWDQTLLRRADAEERSRDRSAGGSMPLREALKELDPGRVSHLLDQRASLLGLLGQGKVLKASEGSFEGHPARKLELGVPVRVDDDLLRARVSASEGRLTIWLDADGLPVASELELSYSGRKGRVFGRFESRSTIRTKYGVKGDRIFVAHRDTAESFTDDSGKRTTFVTMDFQAR